MGPVRQNPIQRTVSSVHICVCSSLCIQLLHTILRRTDLIIFPLAIQTITIAPMMSIWGKRGDDSPPHVLTIWFGSLRHPSKFQRVSLRILASLLQWRRSTEVNQTLHDVLPTPGLVQYVYIFGGSCPPDGILPGAKFTLHPNLAFFYNVSTKNGPLSIMV